MTLPTRSLVPALAAALALAAAPTLAAQQAAEAIPRDLVLALLGESATTLHLGSAPPPARGLPLPPGRIVGGLERAHGSIMVVVEVEGEPPSALAAYDATLEEAGYRRPAPFRPFGDRAGFVGSEPLGAHGWCGDEGFLNPATLSVEGRTYLRVNVQPPESSPCDPDLARRRGFVQPPSLLPSLPPPGGMEVRPSGTGRSSDHEETMASIVTPLPVEAVASAYAELLEAAGWEPSGATTGEGMAARRFAVLDGEGRPWVGLLLVWEVAERRRVALLRLDDPAGQR